MLLHFVCLGEGNLAQRFTSMHRHPQPQQPWPSGHGRPDPPASTAPQAFQSYIKTILTRKNTINGVTYSEDPTIMAVELANEPHTRCGAPRCGRAAGARPVSKDGVLMMS